MRKGTHPSWTEFEWDQFYRDCISDHYLEQVGCGGCERRQFGECKKKSGRCESFLPTVDAVIHAVDRADREWEAGEWVPVEDHNSESGLKRRT